MPGAPLSVEHLNLMRKVQAAAAAGVIDADAFDAARNNAP
jgi:hypothetical protein